MAMAMEVEEAEGFAGGAEALHTLAPGASISLRYHSLFGAHNDLLLLEVDEKLLPDIIHQRVTIRGKPNEEAVLCTAAETYAMKFVGTSNSVFLIPPGDSVPQSTTLASHPCGANVSSVDEVSSVFKVASGNMELVLVAPRLDKLKILLNERPYRLEEESETDFQNRRGLFSWQDLLDQIQASEQELRDGLKSLSAVEIDAYWRIVDRRTMDETLNMILNNSIVYSWPLNALPEDEVLSRMEADEYPHMIVLHCLDTFGSKVGEISPCILWCLDERKVCIHFAIRTLDGGIMKLENFMDKWVRSVERYGMNANLNMLEGEVLYEKIGLETRIHAFSISSLPSTPAERFAVLFHERPKWQWKDLEPYIRDLRVPGLSSEGLLMKYTRRTQPSKDAEPVFSAR